MDMPKTKIKLPKEEPVVKKTKEDKESAPDDAEPAKDKLLNKLVATARSHAKNGITIAGLKDFFNKVKEYKQTNPPKLQEQLAGVLYNFLNKNIQMNKKKLPNNMNNALKELGYKEIVKEKAPVDEKKIKQHLREFDDNYLMDLIEKNRYGDPDMYSTKDAEDDLKKDMKKEGINILADYLDPDEIDMIKKDFGKKKDFWKYYSSMLNINKKKEKKKEEPEPEKIYKLISELYDKEMVEYNKTGNSQNIDNKPIIDEIYDNIIINKSITEENKILLKEYLTSLTGLALHEDYWDDVYHRPIIERQIKLISSGLLLKGNDKEIEKRLITRRKFLTNNYGI
tara:strand:- start:201 stop:1217 length:1017 start_codon:yes stop_codon:yes gene_type:complete